MIKIRDLTFEYFDRDDEGNLTAYFVDSISFKELDQFINLEKVLPEKESEIPQKEEYKPLTKVEELEEQNYNMVDLYG